MHKKLELAGRVLYALAFIGFAVYHFMYAGVMAALVPSYFPAAVFLVYLVGAVFLWAAVTLLINRGVHYSLPALSALLLLFILTIHLPNVLNGNGAEPFLLKDMALLGATLFMFGASFPQPKKKAHSDEGEIR